MDIRQKAVEFLKDKTPDQRDSLKRMLAHGVTCGIDFAYRNGINLQDFQQELINIFKGK